MKGKHKKKAFLHAILILLVLISPILPIKADFGEIRHFHNELWNSEGYRKLIPDQQTGGYDEIVGLLRPEGTTFYHGVRVYKNFKSEGTEISEGVIGIVSHNELSTVEKNATWDFPQTDLVITDTIVIVAYWKAEGEEWVQYGGYNSWKTEELEVTQMESQTWIFYFWIGVHWVLPTFDWQLRFKFGINYWDTRIVVESKVNWGLRYSYILFFLLSAFVLIALLDI